MNSYSQNTFQTIFQYSEQIIPKPEETNYSLVGRFFLALFVLYFKQLLMNKCISFELDAVFNFDEQVFKTTVLQLSAFS